MAGCLFALLSLSAVAAEQGKLGSTSSSRFTISLAIQASLEITTVSDITINITDRTVDAEFTQSFCVQGNGSNKYAIVAYGSIETGVAFTLQNADGENLPYYVSFNGDPDAVDFEPLTPGVPSSNYNVLPRDFQCNELTAFKVKFRAADLQSVGSGLYSGSLTLLVSPV